MKLLGIYILTFLCWLNLTGDRFIIYVNKIIMLYTYAIMHVMFHKDFLQDLFCSTYFFPEAIFYPPPPIPPHLVSSSIIDLLVVSQTHQLISYLNVLILAVPFPGRLILKMYSRLHSLLPIGLYSDLLLSERPSLITSGHPLTLPCFIFIQNKYHYLKLYSKFFVYVFVVRPH